LQRIDGYLSCLHEVRCKQDEETIHRFRVAARNLLAVYPLFPSQARPKRWKKKIKKRLTALNRLRDLQVLQTRIKGHDAILMMDIMGEMQGWNPARGKQAGRKLARQLQGSGRTAARMIRHHPDDFVARLRDEWFKVHALLAARLLAANSGQPKTLHKLRVAYKSFRYLVIFLHDAGELPELDREEIKYWQDMMGSIQDREVAAVWLADHHLQDAAPTHALEEESARLRLHFMRRRRRFRQFIDGIIW